MNSDLITRFVAALDAAEATSGALAVVDEFAGAAGKTAGAFLEEVTFSVGESFASGTMSFDDAMGNMAGIYNALSPSDLIVAGDGESLAYQLYWALDEGEYGHDSDGITDPIQSRALPAVRKVLDRRPSIVSKPGKS